MPSRGHTDGSQRTSVYDPLLSPLHMSNLWTSCPLMEYLHDPSIGVLLDERWTSYNAQATTGDYVLTQAAAGTAAISTAHPGALLMDAGATTDNQGANLQRLKSAFVPAANKSIWAEFRVALTAATPPVTRAQIFVGLAASDTTIIGSGVMTTDNHIGWLIEDGELLVSKFSADKAGTGVDATGHTFVDAAPVRLGFFYDGVADTLQQYVNGAKVGAPIATANIPKVAVYPSFVCQSDATDRPNLIVFPYRIFQLR